MNTDGWLDGQQRVHWDRPPWSQRGLPMMSGVLAAASPSKLSASGPLPSTPKPASQDVSAVYNHSCFFNVHLGSPAAGNGKLIFIDSGAGCHVCPMRWMGRREGRPAIIPDVQCCDKTPMSHFGRRRVLGGGVFYGHRSSRLQSGRCASLPLKKCQQFAASRPLHDHDARTRCSAAVVSGQIG